MERYLKREQNELDLSGRGWVAGTLENVLLGDWRLQMVRFKIVQEDREYIVFKGRGRSIFE